MASVKAVKVRKDHVCDICKETITKGEMAYYFEDRVPVGSADEWGFSQEGIEYIKAYRHIYICKSPDDFYVGCFANVPMPKIEQKAEI